MKIGNYQEIIQKENLVLDKEALAILFRFGVEEILRRSRKPKESF